MTNSKRRTIAWLVGSLLAGITTGVLAQGAGNYPDKPIKFIVPFPAGGGGDTSFRFVAQRLTSKLGQSVVVENRPGAAGNIGFKAGADAAPDGYTITGLAQPVVINPFMFKAKMVDPSKEFQPIGTVNSYSLVLVANKALGVNTLQELVSLAKAKPGQISFGSLGGTVQLSITLLGNATGTRYLTVPYKGTADQATAVVANTVNITSLPVAVAQPFIKDGRIVPLAYFGRKRQVVMPDVPTAAEIYPGVVMAGWLGLAFPTGTPRPIVDKVARALDEILREPASAEFMVRTGNDDFIIGPDEFARVIRDDLGRLEKLTKDAGVVPE